MTSCRAVIFLCLLLFFHSCKKENLIDAGNTFHRTKSEPAGSIRVFARSGEVTNPSIVQRFEIQDSALISFYARGSGSFDTIRILDNHEARLFQYSYTNYSYNVHFNELKFTGKDTTTGFSYLEVYSRTLSYFLALYKPEIYREYVVSSTAGAYNFGYRSRNEYRLLKDNEKLKAPWIVALLHNKAFGIRAHWLQNKLDPNFYQQLAEKDTVVLSEHFLFYEK
jgi:hypothetical protein